MLRLTTIVLSVALAQGARASTEFATDVEPVLRDHCYACHSHESKKAKGGLVLDSRNGIITGGDSGPAAVPGKPEASLLIQVVTHAHPDLQMPRGDGAEKLADSEIAKLQSWIAAGLPHDHPGTSPARGRPDDADLAATHWSFQPIANPPVPAVSNGDWPQNAIDRFVLARLEVAGLAPNPPAPPHTLLRRLSFDLTGLPPTLEDIAAFEASETAATVGRLLDSPDFAPRWARHWLDVARYAESSGKDRDVLMPHAWRYRDYVIAAFAENVPYDQFLREQLAGDLMAADRPGDRDRLVTATGFLAIGAKSFTSGKEGLRMDLVDDQIDAVTQSMLGLTVACARCHDHKFDPVPTADYYALAGIFRSTEPLYGYANNNIGKVPLQQVTAVLGADADDRLAEWKAWDDRRKKLAKNKNDKGALKEHLKKEPSLDVALAAREEKKPADIPVLIRGELGNKAKTATPRGFLSALDIAAPAIPDGASGRLQLAQWITDPDNPLAPRVAVNRVWAHLFGKGIVATVDNFGITGDPPSHPELLDYLAHRFVHHHRWDTKALIAEITASRTYQQSSAPNPAAESVDPGNALYWRMDRRRLEAEPLRDAMLAVSGDLVRDAPPFGSLVAKIGDGEVGRNIDEKPLADPFPYRAVYLPVIRTKLNPYLKLFDFPEPSNPQGQRSQSSVPAQALYLMNSPFVLERAAAFAGRIAESAPGTADRITEAFLSAYARPPTAAELDRFTAFIEGTPDAWPALTQTLLASAEFRYVD